MRARGVSKQILTNTSEKENHNPAQSISENRKRKNDHNSFYDADRIWY